MFNGFTETEGLQPSSHLKPASYTSSGFLYSKKKKKRGRKKSGANQQPPDYESLLRLAINELGADNQRMVDLVEKLVCAQAGDRQYGGIVDAPDYKVLGDETDVEPGQ